MAEQTYKSPGFFEREIDLSERKQEPFGVPAAVVAPALRGPAFVPVTVGSFADFVSKFGGLDSDRFGPYAVNEFLRHKSALTYVRVLGAGANTSETDVSRTLSTGQVKNAGFVVTGTLDTDNSIPSKHKGSVQFLVASHDVNANSDIGMPMFADNDSFNKNGSGAKLVRGMLMMASDSRAMVTNGGAVVVPGSLLGDDHVQVTAGTGVFKLIISSSAGSSWTTTDKLAGIKVYSASLNPASASYIGNVLNTDPNKFEQEKHLLYAHFPVDDEVASVSESANMVAMMSGSAKTSGDSALTSLTFREMFGQFDTRYAAAKTPKFISQPFGTREYDLFTVESLDDGAYANDRYKISITNIRKSTDERSDYGTFSLEVRDFNDNDNARKVLEQFDGLTLNPDDESFVGKKIGDKKVSFNHDASSEDERRLLVTGQYANKSRLIRVNLEQALKDGEVPADALPFGHRGPELLKTTQTVTDYDSDATTNNRLVGTGLTATTTPLSSSLVPPIPFRTKVTRGSMMPSGSNFIGAHSKHEVVNGNLYWGVKFEKNTSPLNANTSTSRNDLIRNFTKFMGLRKLDAVHTGSTADTFNNNKFTLARVAFGNTSEAHVTGSARDHMLDAVYLRNGSPDAKTYAISTGSNAASAVDRITLATLVALSGSTKFNKFSNFAKFTTFMHGGFDGLNILDKNAAKLNDKSTSTDTNGGAATSFTSPGLLTNVAGTKLNNNGVASYRTAVDLLSSEFVSNHNILAIPGIREPLVTDHSSDQTRDYGKAINIMDIPQYDNSGNRLFDDRAVKPDVEKTIDALTARGFDNNYASTYFPDVEIDDAENSRRVRVPASVPAMAALAFNDKVAFPWFAPAGFNRAALDFVKNVDVRLSAPDRDDLYDAKINPIATFPRTGYVIFGQKTLQHAKSSLDRVNVRRLLNEVKRLIGDIAQNLLFEPNTPATRKRFVSQAILQLGIVQSQAGLETFKVVMDSSNNTQNDVEENRLNGKIIIVPTRTIEFIAIDFIITNAGVEFV